MYDWQNNLMSKVVCAGMDLAGLWPKYINTRRGSIAVYVVGVLCQPWRFVTQPSTLVSTLSAFGSLSPSLSLSSWLPRDYTSNITLLLFISSLNTSTPQGRAWTDSKQYSSPL